MQSQVLRRKEGDDKITIFFRVQNYWPKKGLPLEGSGGPFQLTFP